VDRLFLRIVGLREAMQKLCCCSDVLIGPSELWGIIPPVHGVALDPTGVTLGAVRRSMHTGRSVVHRACWRS